MGAVASVQQGQRQQRSLSQNSNGTHSTKQLSVIEDSEAECSSLSNKESSLDEVKWKMLPSSEEAIEMFQKDGTLGKTTNLELLELRMMLDDPIAQRALARFAKDRKNHDIFMCWLDAHEFKSIPTPDYRRSKALHMYHKYIKPGAVLEIGGVDGLEREHIKQQIECSQENHGILSNQLYEKVQQICFNEIHNNIYQQFKKTDGFSQLTAELSSRYNNVRVEDFEYMQKLGEGGFGLVVQCRKRSTGKHYAMKIQTKLGLLECFADDPRRADFEKQAFACCQHPFIINLDYAFQTDSLAIMVLGLATAGDLQRAQRKEPNERLPEERVRFYVAEVVLALGYMHQLGLMYRDLKPNNILLNSDGHVLLVDLGGVLDQDGRVLGKNTEQNSMAMSPLFAKRYEASLIPLQGTDEIDVVNGSATGVSDDTESGKKRRRMSIMGTFGYMAPEMVIMLGQTSTEKCGYTNAVDWWSLGVTIYKLLTGERPFQEDFFSEFMELIPTINGRRAPVGLPEYAMLFKVIEYPDHLSNEVIDLISKLLDTNEKTRLGSGPRGIHDIKSHPFFSTIDWEKLEQKHMEPPYVPTDAKKSHGPVFGSFEQMLTDLGKGNWLTELPKEEDQKYFNTWNFTSPHTLRVEVGLANEMEQFDKKFKVQQIMGLPRSPSQALSVRKRN